MDLKKEAARVAFTLIKSNNAIGLGDGLTVRYLAGHIINGIRNGLHVELYTSSAQTVHFLQEAGFTTLDLALVDTLDQYFDGCDQVDQQLNVLKSGAGIHTREKLFAAMAKQFIIMADESKFVSIPGNQFPLVLEVLPQAVRFVQKKMKALVSDSSLTVRTISDTVNPVITRNGNYLVDCFFSAWPDLEYIHQQSKKITGVVEISLFYKMAQVAIIAGNETVRRYIRENDSVALAG